MDQPLAGGSMNDVRRVGETVRRVAGPWTPSVHRLLVHVRARGVPGVPTPIGVDRFGREVLEFLPGEVPDDPMPPWVWDDEALVAAATWLRRFHDATTDFVADGEQWQLPAHPPNEVICHNDLAPYNLVFDADHQLVGVIDFDTCSPGSRVWDLAYLAYRMVPFHAPGTPQVPLLDATERTERLGRLCESYGAPARPRDVLAMISPRVRELHAFTAARAAAAGPASGLHGHLAAYERDLAHLTALTTSASGPARQRRRP